MINFSTKTILPYALMALSLGGVIGCRHSNSLTPADPHDANTLASGMDIESLLARQLNPGTHHVVTGYLSSTIESGKQVFVLRQTGSTNSLAIRHTWGEDGIGVAHFNQPEETPGRVNVHLEVVGHTDAGKPKFQFHSVSCLECCESDSIPQEKILIDLNRIGGSR